jgi:hypothetical protein
MALLDSGCGRRGCARVCSTTGDGFCACCPSAADNTNNIRKAGRRTACPTSTLHIRYRLTVWPPCRKWLWARP